MDGRGELEFERQAVVWQQWVEERRWWILAGLVGVALIGVGVQKWNSPSDESRVEVVSASVSRTVSKKINVDVGGSVIKSGVYEFEEGRRVDDALIAAGGLSADADREWVEQSINRAQKLTDGMKLYILKEGEQQNNRSIDQKSNNQGTIAGVQTSGTVSINTASQQELEALWGIGPATARAIIEGRPFSTVEELLERKVLKANVYERNKDKLAL